MPRSRHSTAAWRTHLGLAAGSCSRQLQQDPAMRRHMTAVPARERRSAPTAAEASIHANRGPRFICAAFWRPPGEAVALAGPSFRRRRKPAVEVVEDRFDGWPQLVGDLVLALALEGAASGLGDDDLEDAGERDSPQLCDLGRDCLSLGDGSGEGAGLAV